MEITSYALLAMIEAGRIKHSFPIFSWLLWQRNDRGGFEGTQDTVVGLQALAAYAQATAPSLNDMSIDVSSTDLVAGKAAPTNVQTIKVKAENALVTQKIEVMMLAHMFFLLRPTITISKCGFQIPKTASAVQIKASGTGVALVDVAYRYNLKSVATNASSFVIHPRIKTSESDRFVLEICLKYGKLMARN